MESLQPFYPIVRALLTLIILIGLFVLMYIWAKKQKGIAFAFGMFFQMFLPDPKAQQTIEFVSESKQEEKTKKLQAQTDKDDKT